jgi:hypothetical protein
MRMTFRITLANDDTKTAVANLVAENVLAFIDHIDVMGNNGSLVLEQIDFDQTNVLTGSSHHTITNLSSTRQVPVICLTK